MSAPIVLRPYQLEAVASIPAYYRKKTGNALLVLPTASGKSVIQAAFISEVLRQYPDERFLLLSHVRELLEQNASKLRMLWPEAPVGIYSAGLKRRETDKAITVAGIQSCFRRAAEFGEISLVIIDECHLVPKKGTGMYRRFLKELRELNPKVKIIGMSATPFRLDSGVLHKGDNAIFTDIAYEADIHQLVTDGYLCPLISKLGETRADLTQIKLRGGEYISGEAAKIMDTEALVKGAVDEIEKLCADRNKLLLFCSGVDHAQHVRDELHDRGIATACVTGDTPGDQRDQILADFQAGKLRAVTNVNVLTTGFDAPDIDAIILLRPTHSTGLYVQMLGRGMRLHESKEDTLILDFAGNILEHGPIDQIRVDAGNDKEGVKKAPQRECPECQALISITAMACPDCGHEFHRAAREVKHATEATSAKVMGGKSRRYHEIPVDSVTYSLHRKQGKPPSLKVSYHCGLAYYSEWICLEHTGYARQKAKEWWRARSDDTPPHTVESAVREAKRLPVPASIVLDTYGRYPQIVRHNNLYTPPELGKAS